jgi:hypothetical protein
MFMNFLLLCFEDNFFWISRILEVSASMVKCTNQLS